jgi:hypothetical protein
MSEKLYEMVEGIEIKNTQDGRVGVAVEYTYSNMFVYRMMKCPDCVYVDVDGQRELWRLKHCEPN